MNGNIPATIYQNISTIIGNTYLLSFFVTGSNDDPDFNASRPIKWGIVSATGAQVEQFSINSASSNNIFQMEIVKYYFKATTKKTTIFIGSSTPTYHGPIIGNVKVTPMVFLIIFKWKKVTLTLKFSLRGPVHARTLFHQLFQTLTAI